MELTKSLFGLKHIFAIEILWKSKNWGEIVFWFNGMEIKAFKEPQMVSPIVGQFRRAIWSENQELTLSQYSNWREEIFNNEHSKWLIFSFGEAFDGYFFRFLKNDGVIWIAWFKYSEERYYPDDIFLNFIPIALLIEVMQDLITNLETQGFIFNQNPFGA